MELEVGTQLRSELGRTAREAPVLELGEFFHPQLGWSVFALPSDPDLGGSFQPPADKHCAPWAPALDLWRAF